MAITRIDDIKRLAEPKEVELPSWVSGEKVVFKLKRPSMLGLVAGGHIPNPLLTTAQKVFTQTVDSTTKLSDIFEVMRAIIKMSMVEPTYQELEDAQIELTDEQMTSIFQYTQTGVVDLDRFHKQ